jgi:hypothetical protein
MNYIQNCFVTRKIKKNYPTFQGFYLWEATVKNADRIRYGEKVNKLTLTNTETTSVWHVDDAYRKEKLIHCYIPRTGEIFVDLNGNECEVLFASEAGNTVNYDYVSSSLRGNPINKTLEFFWKNFRPVVAKKEEIMKPAPESTRKTCYLVYCQDTPYERLNHSADTPDSFSSFDKAKAHADDLAAVGLFPAILWGQYDPTLYYELPASGLLLLR